MNKFIAIFALVATLSAGALAQTESEIERKETELLIGNEKLFGRYCLAERAKIISGVKGRMSKETSEMFQIFFDGAAEIADEVLNAEKKAIEEFAKTIKSPDEQVSTGLLSEVEIEDLIEQGKREIQSSGNVFGRIVAATKSLVGPVLSSVVNSAVFVRLAKLRSHMKADTMLRALVQTCKQVADYQEMLEEDLAEAKLELKEGASSELQQFIDSMNVSSLKCHTTKFVTRSNTFCNLIKVASNPMMKMLGFGSDFQLPREDEPVFKADV